METFFSFCRFAFSRLLFHLPNLELPISKPRLTINHLPATKLSATAKMLSKHLLALSWLIVITLAAPLNSLPASTSLNTTAIHARHQLYGNRADVFMYRDTSCSGTVHGYGQIGGVGCYPVLGIKQSVIAYVSGEYVPTHSIWVPTTGLTDCSFKITTWSGKNCRGSSVHVPGSDVFHPLYGGCVDVPYASVLIEGPY